MTSSTIDNVDLENIVIDPATDGSITITAEIEDANPPEVDYKRSKAATVAFAPSRTAQDGIVISGGDTYEFIINSSTQIDNGAGDYCTGCDEIPAFFSHGSIDVVYNLLGTTEPDSKIDLTCDTFIEFHSPPEWYPYPLLNFINTTGQVSMAQAMQGLITAGSRSTKHDIIAEGTTLISNFSINSWPGIMPIVVKDIIRRDSNGVALPEIKRGCLPPAQFIVRIHNNLGYDVTLSSIQVKVIVNYYEDDWLMDMTNTSKQNVCKLYPSPKYLLDTDPKHLWAIVDGYEKAYGDKRIDEIVRVYGYYLESNSADTTIQNIKCLTLDPIISTGDQTYLPFVYKSRDDSLISTFDHARQNSKGFESNEKAWVCTPADVTTINGKFAHATVYTGADDTGIILPPNHPDCEFIIETALRDDIEEEMSEAEFLVCFDKIRYYDAVVPFDKKATIKRIDIDKVFYETLADTFEESVIYESTRGDIPPFCRIKINEKTDWLPIYQNSSLKFSESLSKCNDGVRSRDIFYYSQSQSFQTTTNNDPNAPVVNLPKVNKITLKPTKKRYSVGIIISYGKFKGVHIHEYVEPKTGP